jgi:hypothetical protein
MTRKMISCRDGVVSLNANQTKEENQHPENMSDENLMKEARRR